MILTGWPPTPHWKCGVWSNVIDTRGLVVLLLFRIFDTHGLTPQPPIANWEVGPIWSAHRDSTALRRPTTGPCQVPRLLITACWRTTASNISSSGAQKLVISYIALNSVKGLICALSCRTSNISLSLYATLQFDTLFQHRLYYILVSLVQSIIYIGSEILSAWNMLISMWSMWNIESSGF